MKIVVKAKTNSKYNQITPPQFNLLNDAIPEYRVEVKAKPKDGEANEMIWKLLSKHFNVPKAKIRLISGYKSKIKVFEIGED